MAHAWESPEPCSQGSDAPAHAWEHDEGDGDMPDVDSASNSSLEEPDPLEDATAAADLFLEELLSNYLESKISAESFCIMCYWASKGGLAGTRVAEYGLRPGHSTGNYSKHIKQVLHMDNEQHYRLSIPAAKKNSLERAKVDIPMRLIHDVVAHHEKEDPGLHLRLAEAISAGELPQCYSSHPVVRRHEAPVLPYCLYVDSVAYSLTDSVVGFWLVSLIGAGRVLLGTIRKQMLCQRGCRGRCSFHPIMDLLRWSMSVAATGVHPAAKHDGTAFDVSDSHRRDLAGQTFSPAAILFFKGDWAEFTERLGYPTCASNLRPCFCCSSAPGPEFCSPRGVTSVGGPWHLNTNADFEHAFRSCEVQVVVTRDLHRLLLQHLGYDRRKNGSHGRALLRDLAEAGLLQGDRLEPQHGLMDIGDFDRLSSFPITLTFWRPASSTLVLFRSPIWDASLGIEPASFCALDLLHTLYLGPMHAIAMESVHLVIESNVHGPHAPSDYEGKLITLSVFWSALQGWYSEFDKAHVGKPCTRLSKLTAKMIGLGGRKRLKTKGMETYYLLCFIVEYLPRFADAQLGAHRSVLLEAGRNLLLFVERLKAMPTRLEGGHASELMHIYQRFASVIGPLELTLPKIHLMFHVIQRSLWQGNPLLYHCWSDEGANSVLRRVARACHQMTFEDSLLFKFTELTRRSGRQRLH